jgi:4-amino-4-deoxy-L-arabinose transferase-like glycosyltransferase
MTPSPSFLRRDLLCLSLFLSLLFGVFLGNRPLMVPDEGRYAEIPREMLESGDYLTPHLNHIKYFEKPPLFYWMTAVSIKLFGVQEWGLRAGGALLSLLGCLMVYIAGLRLYDRRTGMFACLMLATSALYSSMARFLITDVPLTFWMTLSLLLFILGTQERLPAKKRYYFWGMYIFAALAVMTKGLIGAVLPGIVIFAWLCITWEWKQLKTYCIPTGILLFFLIAAPWHLLVQLKNPEFFRFYFIEQHFLRYLTDYAGRQQAAWFFPVVTLGGFFPWVCFLLAFIVQAIPRWRHFVACQKSKQTIFFIVWALVLFLFFSFSKSLLLSYALPLMPPLALLMARCFSLQEQDPFRGVIRLGFWLVVLFGVAMGLAGIILLQLDLLPSLILTYMAIFILALGTISSGVLYIRTKRLHASFFLLVCTVGIFSVMGDMLYPKIDTRSVKSLVIALQPKLKPDTEIATYHAYYQDLPAYLGRRVTVVAYQGELEFGMAHQDTSAWMLDDATFWQRWEKKPDMFLLMRQEDYLALTAAQKAKLHPVAKTTKDILLEKTR